MDQTTFWKNFRLGTELDIAGRFIYNGLRQLREMENLAVEEEVFEFLYSLSVGIERLLKVAVVLIEHDPSADQEEFEKSLITHDHLGLLYRVRKSGRTVNLAGPHSELLQLLAGFYKTYRYGRFSQASAEIHAQEKGPLHKYVERHLKIVIQEDPLFSRDEKMPRLRKFIGSKVGKIAEVLYELICEEAGRLGTYTHELRSNSKAEKIFGRKQFDFSTEDAIWREVLVFIANSQTTTGHIGYVKRMKPLDLDPGLIVDYLQCFSSEPKKLEVMDEIEALYGELEKPGDREKAIHVIGDPAVHFKDEDEE